MVSGCEAAEDMRYSRSEIGEATRGKAGLEAGKYHTSGQSLRERIPYFSSKNFQGNPKSLVCKEGKGHS